MRPRPAIPAPRPARRRRCRTSGSAPRTREAAPITLPPPIRAPSTSTVLAPIHTSSPMQMPPRLGWKPWSRIGRSGSANAWLVGAKVQFAATSTLRPMRMPLPVYSTQPELMTLPRPITRSPLPPAGLILTKASITTSSSMTMRLPRCESSMSARCDTRALGAMHSMLVLRRCRLVSLPTRHCERSEAISGEGRAYSPPSVREIASPRRSDSANAIEAAGSRHRRFRLTAISLAAAVPAAMSHRRRVSRIPQHPAGSLHRARQAGRIEQWRAGHAAAQRWRATAPAPRRSEAAATARAT